MDTNDISNRALLSLFLIRDGVNEHLRQGWKRMVGWDPVESLVEKVLRQMNPSLLLRRLSFWLLVCWAVLGSFSMYTFANPERASTSSKLMLTLIACLIVASFIVAAISSIETKELRKLNEFLERENDFMKDLRLLTVENGDYKEIPFEGYQRIHLESIAEDLLKKASRQIEKFQAERLAGHIEQPLDVANERRLRAELNRRYDLFRRFDLVKHPYGYYFPTPAAAKG